MEFGSSISLMYCRLSSDPDFGGGGNLDFRRVSNLNGLYKVQLLNALKMLETADASLSLLIWLQFFF